LRVAAALTPTLGFLALGDSYTIGEGVAAAECWPRQLTARLRAQGVALGEPRIIANTGWTCAELISAIARSEPACAAPTYALVTLLIGVNDQYRDHPEADYAARWQALLKRAIALCTRGAAGCLAISIPDWGSTPFATQDPRGPAAVSAAIDRYNAIAAQIARAHHVIFCDITQVSRQSAVARALVADGLHPDAAQYAAWVGQVLAPAAQRGLTGPGAANA